MPLGFVIRRSRLTSRDRPIRRAMARNRHGDGSCDAARSAYVRRLFLTIPRSEEPPLPVAVCSAAGVPSELVRLWPSGRAACCRGTTRHFAAPHITLAGPRRSAAATAY